LTTKQVPAVAHFISDRVHVLNISINHVTQTYQIASSTKTIKISNVVDNFTILHFLAERMFGLPNIY